MWERITQKCEYWLVGIIGGHHSLDSSYIDGFNLACKRRMESRVTVESLADIFWEGFRGPSGAIFGRYIWEATTYLSEMLRGQLDTFLSMEFWERYRLEMRGLSVYGWHLKPEPWSNLSGSIDRQGKRHKNWTWAPGFRFGEMRRTNKETEMGPMKQEENQERCPGSQGRKCQLELSATEKPRKQEWHRSGPLPRMPPRLTQISNV